MLSSNGRGLGRSLGHAGRSQIGLSAKLFSNLLPGTVVPKLPCRTISQAFARNSCSRVALQSNFLRYCLEPLCKSCLAKLLLELLCGPAAQVQPRKATS